MTEPDWIIRLAWVASDESPFKAMIPQNVSMREDIDLLIFVLSPPTTGQDEVIWVNEKYDILYVNFVFERRMTANIVNIYIPSSLIVSLSWISFWLDVEAVPGRVSLGIMSILTIVTQIHQTKSQLPPINYVTALDVWMLGCLFFVTASMVEYAIAYTVERKAKPSKEKPLDADKMPLNPPEITKKRVMTTDSGVWHHDMGPLLTENAEVEAFRRRRSTPNGNMVYNPVSPTEAPPAPPPPQYIDPISNFEEGYQYPFKRYKSNRDFHRPRSFTPVAEDRKSVV